MAWTQESATRWNRSDGLRLDVERREPRLVLYVSRAGIGIDRDLHAVVAVDLGDCTPHDCKKLWRRVQAMARAGSADLTKCRASVVFVTPMSGDMDAFETAVVQEARAVLDAKLPILPT